VIFMLNLVIGVLLIILLVVVIFAFV